jgi:DNA-binding LytR/AlgR family response regulator
MRTTLKELHKQVPDAIRIHKSYLINPAYIERTKGGKKDRFIILDSVSKPIPVSRDFDVSKFI